MFALFVSLCGVIEEEGMLHLFGAQVFLKGRAMFRVMKGAHWELLLTLTSPTAHGEAEPELQPCGGETLLLSTVPGTASPGLAQTPAISCPTEVLRSQVCVSCTQYYFLFKWHDFEFQCISICSFLLNHDEEGRGTGKLCFGCLCLVCHMFILL